MINKLLILGLMGLSSCQGTSNSEVDSSNLASATKRQKVDAPVKGLQPICAVLTANIGESARKEVLHSIKLGNTEFQGIGTVYGKVKTLRPDTASSSQHQPAIVVQLNSQSLNNSQGIVHKFLKVSANESEDGNATILLSNDESIDKLVIETRISKHQMHYGILKLSPRDESSPDNVNEYKIVCDSALVANVDAQP
jgi:hypothetical protein